MLRLQLVVRLTLMSTSLLNLIEAYTLGATTLTSLPGLYVKTQSGLQRYGNPSREQMHPKRKEFIFGIEKRSSGNSDITSTESPLLKSGLDRNPRRETKRDIFFPGEDRFASGHPISPRCAESGKLFCTRVENYPSNIIEKVLNVEPKKFVELFGEDEVPELNPSVIQRFDEFDEESLCQSSVKLIYPQAGLTKDNHWSFIVNQPNYTQGVRIEECVNPGSPCAMTDSFPNRFTTKCRQKYIYRQLVSVSPEGKVVKDLFKLPSCCMCILKSDPNRSRREVSKHTMK